VACHIIYKGKILFLLRNKNKPQGNLYGVPAGKVEKKESVEKAIEREIKEETGLVVAMKDLEFQKVFNVTYDEYSFKFHVYHLYLDKEPVIQINKGEHKSYVWSSPEEALKLDLIEDEDNVIKELFNLN
jgi:8-oxo-dGTP pyrophosphatase MutT (NUDIX family)